MEVSFPDLALEVHGLECDGVVGDNRDGVPDILWPLFFKEGDTASVLPTEHGLDRKLEPFLAS